MNEILDTLIAGEEILVREWQYVLTRTRHIKLRKGITNYGNKYKKISKQIFTLTGGLIKTPKVIDNGKIGEYEFVICERIISIRDATNSDVEEILSILEDIRVPEFLGVGPMIEKPPFLIDYEFELENLSEKLDLINFKDKKKVNTIVNKVSVSTSKYTLQHGDLRHRNIIIVEGGIYLVDLDNVGVYPYYFERFYISSYLGIPISCTSIDDNLLKLVNILTCSKTVNEVTIRNQNVIRSIVKRISLILDSRTAGINNLS